MGTHAAVSVRMCRLNNVDELKQRLAYAWKGLQQNVIDSAISEWRKRLKACIRAQRRHFGHALQSFSDAHFD